MKHIERIGLIDRIGRELQSRMSFNEIRLYLRGFGVDTAKETSGVNSKWVFVKDLLADSPPDVVLRVADELEIPHKYTVRPDRAVAESAFWEANHFRLFISHLATFKRTVGALQASLKRFGISAFVAHVDIEPTKEWQDEIEAALYSMDAMAAVFMPGFKESNWTDQEVGIAIGRGALVIPVIRGLNPYGFVAKYQGLQASGKTVAAVANGLFEILVRADRTRARILTCLVATVLTASTEETALDRLSQLSRVADLPRAFAEQLRDGAAQSGLILGAEDLRTRVNHFLKTHALSPIEEPPMRGPDLRDDDIPF
jgi:hypothetical protein